MQGNIYRHKCWKFKPYKVRGLFLSPIVVLEMADSVVTKGFYTCSHSHVLSPNKGITIYILSALNNGDYCHLSC